ncbi:MAG: SiaB family protein kinase [Pseudomonadota bacterium]
MSMSELVKLREAFFNNGIMICFNGPFSHSIIEEIGMAVKRHLQDKDVGKDAVTDVFAVYIEQTQNVKKYIAKKNFRVHAYNDSIITIARKEEKYIISSGNVIAKEDTPALLEKLEQINSLDKPGLKKRYRLQLRSELPAGSSGAGLGLIDIARRASEKMTYTVDEIDPSHDFFSLNVVI